MCGVVNFLTTNGLCGAESSGGILISKIDEEIKMLDGFPVKDTESMTTLTQLRSIRQELAENICIRGQLDTCKVEDVDNLIEGLFKLPFSGQKIKEGYEHIQMCEDEQLHMNKLDVFLGRFSKFLVRFMTK